MTKCECDESRKNRSYDARLNPKRLAERKVGNQQLRPEQGKVQRLGLLRSLGLSDPKWGGLTR